MADEREPQRPGRFQVPQDAKTGRSPGDDDDQDESDSKDFGKARIIPEKTQEQDAEETKPRTARQSEEVSRRRGVSVDEEDESSETLPGVTIDQNTFVVLSSRLGRKMVPLPKINPDDASEVTKYHTPDAFERGEVITIHDLEHSAPAPGYRNNLERLLKLGAIGRMDHPEANEAVTGLRNRRMAEEKARDSQGIPRV